MFTTIDEATRRQARAPHELLMINLALFHLLLAPAAIALDIGAWGLLLTPLFSGLVIAYIYRRARQVVDGPWLVMAHWQLALRRCYLLLLGYGISGVIIGGGALVSLSAGQASMRDIIFTIATRIGVMPTVIVVLISFVLANSALEQANRGEVPEGIRRRFPPPATPS